MNYVVWNDNKSYSNNEKYYSNSNCKPGKSLETLGPLALLLFVFSLL